jgi:hypothetical protein
MKKKHLLILPLLSLSSLLFAQTPTDSLAIDDDDDIEAFGITDFDLDEESTVTQSASSMASYNDDMFLSKTNFRFGHSYYSPHNYEQRYRTTTVNGAQVNDVLRGQFSFSSLFGGLSDVTRNQQGITPYEQNSLNYYDVGGGANLNIRPSMMRMGSRLSLALTNRNYIGRLMFAHSTGIKNGWAFAGAVNARYGEEGQQKGTYMHAAAIYLGAERFFNRYHTLSLSLLFSPTEQATSSWTTEEAYWLANSHYYNPFWGYQNGKKRSSRVRKTMEPTAVLTWDWNISPETKLTTTNIFRYAKYGQTYINRTNNAADPRPDYYHYMPSNVFNVYSGVAPNEWEYSEWRNYVGYWQASERNRQIDWDKMYMINQNSVKNGSGEAVYYLEESHQDQFAWNLGSTLRHNIDRYSTVNAGLNLNHTTGMFYKTMNDLLGATYHTDLDRFASSDYGAYSNESQNDLDHPSRIIKKGDKFGYNYHINVNKGQMWSSYSFTHNNVSGVFNANVNGTTIERVGKMRNGRSPEHSKGSSGTAKFMGGGMKAQIGVSAGAHHFFNVSGGFEFRPPTPSISFLNVQTRNAFVFDLKDEFDVFGEATYKFNFGKLRGQVKGFLTQFSDVTEQSQFFDDIKQEYSYLSMTGIKKRHYGLEMAAEYRFTTQFSVDFVGSITDAKYTNNADAVICYDKSDAEQTPHWWDPIHHHKLKVVTDGMKVGCTPLTALSLGARYNVNGWFLEARANYYARTYIYFSPYLRLTDVMPDVAKTFDQNGHGSWAVDKMKGGVLKDENGEITSYCPKSQEKFDDAIMCDISIGRSFRLHHGRTLNFNLNLNNVTNNRNMKLRGSEQSRNDDFDKTGKVRSYQFAYNSKYAYAYPFTAYLTIGLRF